MTYPNALDKWARVSDYGHMKFGNVELTTKQKVQVLTEKGRTPRRIAAELEISTQAVYQHLKSLGLEPVREEEKTA